MSASTLDDPSVPCGRRASSSRALVALIAVALAAGVLWTGCASPEERAESRYQKALDLVEQDRLEDAVLLFEEIVRRYPGTPAARRAGNDLVLYRGLENAERRYPVVRARDVVVNTARAIEAYRGRHRQVPAALGDLVPDWLDESPVDPWGRPIAYEPRGARGYRLECLGADGEAGGAGENGDFVVVNGEFVESPSLAADP